MSNPQNGLENIDGAAAPDFSALLEQAQALQTQLVEAREQAAQQIITGSAAGGAVTVSLTGNLEFESVHIDPSVTDDVEMLEDLVLAALRDGVKQVNALNAQAVGNLFG